MIHASAPGKIILFGEHVSRYGKPALIMAIDQRLHVMLSDSDSIVLNSPDLNAMNEKYPSEKLNFVSGAIKHFFTYTDKKGTFRLDTKSEMTEGVGTSAASVVATIGALDAYFGTKLSQKEILKIGFDTIFEIQGFGSGQDIATATYGGLVHFEKDKEIYQVTDRKLPIVIGNTGIKVKSGPIVEAVQSKEKKYPFVFDKTIDIIGQISTEGEKAIKKWDLQTLGELMNINHGLLSAAGVSSDVLERLVFAARNAGAAGAKLSGAGIGDNMIALAPGKEQEVAEAIQKAGGRIIKASMAEKGLIVQEK